MEDILFSMTNALNRVFRHASSLTEKSLSRVGKSTTCYDGSLRLGLSRESYLVLPLQETFRFRSCSELTATKKCLRSAAAVTDTKRTRAL